MARALSCALQAASLDSRSAARRVLRTKRAVVPQMSSAELLHRSAVALLFLRVVCQVRRSQLARGDRSLRGRPESPVLGGRAGCRIPAVS
eukprot:7343160-Alexandrium_andersonii.AAC.1